MSDKLQPLHNTWNAIREIRRALFPFLRQLKKHNNNNNDDDHDQGEAEAAVALAMGTLRYMAARLQGQNISGPLRLELDRMRRMLLTIREMNKKKTTMKQQDDGLVVEKSVTTTEEENADKEKKRTGKVLNVAAAERMVKGALSGSHR